MAALTPGQRKVLAELKAARNYRGAPTIARKALIEAGIVESNLSTPDQAHSDRDSEGALQQRPSAGWGPTSESNTKDAEQFLAKAIKLARTGRYKTSGELAQAVQVSAYPGRYNEHSGEAQRLLKAGGGGGSASTAGEGPIRHKAVPGFSVDIPTSEDRTTFDDAGFERAQKRSVLANYLSKRNPHSLLLRSGALSTEAPNPSDFTTTETVTGTEKFRVPGSSASGGTDGDGGTPSAGGLAATATKRANAIDAKHMPYLWGGGHGAKITDASKATPLDCSGAVSAVLGMDPRVSGGFEKWGRPGDGGDKGVTVYANDHHVLMKINGHFFGTSDSNPDGGAGWIPQGALSKQYLAGFTVRHSAR